MAKTNLAAFAQTQKTATAVATAAVANLGTDAPTNTVLLMTAGVEGSLITRLWAIPRATVTPSSLVLFISKDNGTTQRLIDAELMTAATINATSPIPETPFSNYNENTPLRLEAGDRLYVGSQVAASFGIVFKVEYTDF